MMQDDNAYNHYVANEQPSLVDLIKRYPSIKLTAALIMSECHKLKPRFYSVSSSPDVSSTKLDITIAVHTSEVVIGKDATRFE